MYPAELYALVHRGTPGDVDYYRAACAGAGSVLELGCGYGRVLAALEGVETRVGLDLHDGLLAMARAAAPAADVRAGDMRAFDLGRTFDRVLIPHSGLYCLLSDADVRACLACAARHLAPGGRLVADAYVGDGFHATERPEDFGTDELVPLMTVSDGAREWDVAERSTWDRDAQTLEVTYVHTPLDGGAPVEGAIPQRYLLRDQLERLFGQAGLRVETLASGFEGEPYDEDADVWSLVAARASA